jgi:hypothetical protein
MVQHPRAAAQVPQNDNRDSFTTGSLVHHTFPELSEVVE